MSMLILRKIYKGWREKLRRVSLYLEKNLRDWRESEKGEPYTWKICKWLGGTKKGWVLYLEDF
jgi:hypothetical protein